MCLFMLPKCSFYQKKKVFGFLNDFLLREKARERRSIDFEREGGWKNGEGEGRKVEGKREKNFF